MKALNNFWTLLKVVWKDKVDVFILVAWLVFVVYLYVKAGSFADEGSEIVVKVMDNAWAGAAFFWLYGLTSQLRMAWYKIQLAKKNGE